MSLLLIGIITWIAGKIAKVKILETIGKVAIVVAIIIWGLGFIGVHINLPV